MDIPDAAIEAAIEAVSRYPMDDNKAGRAAIEAAMPAIRETIAQEIEAATPPNATGWISGARVDGYREAARIVRGGTP